MIYNAIDLARFLNKNYGALISFDYLSKNTGLDKDSLKSLLQEVCAIGLNLAIKDSSVKVLSKIEFLDKDYIYKNIKGRGRIEVLDCIDSTNNELMRRAENLVSGDCLLAEYQTAGRGRRENRWKGALGQQIMLSFSWEFSSLEELKFLSLAVGVEIASALSELGFSDIKVKWPNDLYLDDGKLGGVLVETMPCGNKVIAIIGVGLNFLDIKSADIDRKVSYLNIRNLNISRNDIAILIINALHKACNNSAEKQFHKYIEDLSRLDYLLNKSLSVDTGSEVIYGTAKGVSEDGELILEDISLNLHYIKAGHII